jgi:hypothetical protein
MSQDHNQLNHATWECKAVLGQNRRHLDMDESARHVQRPPPAGRTRYDGETGHERDASNCLWSPFTWLLIGCYPIRPSSITN